MEIIKLKEEAYIVKDFNSLIVRRNLEEQNKKAVAILKRLNKQKIIGSIFIPKNKKMQKELDSLVKAKRQNKNSIDIIIATFK